MKKPIKFFSSPAGIPLVLIVYSFTILGCILAIREWIISPQNAIICSLVICVVLIISVIFSLYFIKSPLYIVEIHENEIQFKGLFHRYVIPFSQIQGIERRNGRYIGTAFFVLKVEGYDCNKAFYPFVFDRNRKTREIAQEIREVVQKNQVEIQSIRSDKTDDKN